MPEPEQQQTPRLGIGALLRRLQPRFPDLTASKVRFLEDQGLVHPHRTASGYRKYSEEDIERLETVLSLQQERYLPLRVIRDRLDRGLDPAAGAERQVPAAASSPSAGRQPSDDVAAPGAGAPSGRRYTLRELAARSGSEVPLVRELLNHGLLVERSGEFDDRSLVIAEAAGRLSGYGIEPRHLRVLRGASERIVALVDGSVSPLRNRRDPETRQSAVHRAREISSLCLSMMSAMVSTQVDDTVRGLESPEPPRSSR